ncbi:MAG TPA: arginine--tRNA ligase [Nocardioides sp.]|uniref:arginine--tRNA ligase n=1 Tax=uncultured Nocardioides sp. TaxID=198441 RepID=UPI002612D055|nr:arginine--tRNA ligase [uncultured Nocardioides sp.]HRD60851.1 arginine--tRNA ligase [Nocardioides sp.]HRI96339.1 arginine--tRNA ligase [Nocardioides sp.]HRK46974.1 arginine--tRNA ligase [Nocardioides sp.]
MAAIEAAFGAEFAGTDPVLRPSQYADLQVNAPLALAKRLGLPPREVAGRLLAELELADVCEQVEISGPGFINLTLAATWIGAETTSVRADDRIGVPLEPRQRVVIDYSAPNVAKEMHVGHLRTTVVGDALARTLEHLGHDVIRQNHIGDWGTPFGMLIEHLLDVGEGTAEARLLETDPNAFYQGARERFDGDEAFATRSRERVVALQAGDPDTLRLWSELVELSRHYFNRIYSLLGVTLTDDDLAGESTYNDRLASICDELETAGIATISDGALCVFLDGYTGREGKPVPLIIRKSDGGYGYGTTDLATIRYRVEELRADRMLYVIGAPQALHLRMVWDTARLAGWLPEGVDPVHVQIGNVLGEDRKILRTRSGAPLRLVALLDEAAATARAVIDAARPDLDEDTRAAIAPQVGIGAVKYADLSVAHDSEYVFDLARMVALTGDTGPYLQYAAARIRSIFRAADSAPAVLAESGTAQIKVVEPAERALALTLLDFGDVVAHVGADLEPHRLCHYLFGLAQAFSVFYEHCPVLKAEGATRSSRLSLCALTLKVLVHGLDLLGIEAPERM